MKSVMLLQMGGLLPKELGFQPNDAARLCRTGHQLPWPSVNAMGALNVLEGRA